jgi:hypothetical protein
MAISVFRPPSGWQKVRHVPVPVPAPSQEAREWGSVPSQSRAPIRSRMMPARFASHTCPGERERLRQQGVPGPAIPQRPIPGGVSVGDGPTSKASAGPACSQWRAPHAARASSAGQPPRTPARPRPQPTNGVGAPGGPAPDARRAPRLPSRRPPRGGGERRPHQWNGPRGRRASRTSRVECTSSDKKKTKKTNHTLSGMHLQWNGIYQICNRYRVSNTYHGMEPAEGMHVQ